jgi:hypothetical protein
MQLLAQDLGGVFNLSSVIGKGSEIIVSIPLRINQKFKLKQGGAA